MNTAAMASSTGLQRSNVSATAHRLENLGLLSAGATAAGGRGVGFYPTATAADYHAKVRAYLTARLRTASEADLARASDNTAVLIALADAIATTRTAQP